MISEIISLLLSEGRVACPGTPLGSSQSVLLKASYHKKHEYIIWFRIGDLNGLGDI